MTSGISAKGSALGASAPESGVLENRAPAPRPPRTAANGTRRSRGYKAAATSQETGIAKTQETSAGGITAESSHPALAASVRTIILGIDHDGRIVQHDRNAPQILAREPEELLGAQLRDLTAADGVAAVSGLLEAIRSDREGSAMLTIETRDGYRADAVVTVHPMRAGGTSLAALALLRIPAPRAERFVDPALMRKQMLDDTFTRIGDTLDIDHLARELIDALVPHFCNAGDLLLLESLIGEDELPSHGTDGSVPLRRIALLHDRKDPAWEAAFPTGEILRYPAHTPYFRCMDTGAPVLEATISDVQASKIAKAWRRKPVAKLLSGASMLMLPLIARGTVLGFFACTRQEGFRRFDAYDIEIGMDFAARAAVFIDNARRFSREHATALTLQRSMPADRALLPELGRGQAPLPARQQAHRGRRRLVRVHRAARRPGRARCRRRGRARRTRRRHHGPAADRHSDPGHARAGAGRVPAAARRAHAHPRRARAALRDLRVRGLRRGQRRLRGRRGRPPAAVARAPGREQRTARRPAAPPLGIGDGEVESRQFKIADGSLFVLYTDGLVENKGQDISDGLARLRGIFGPGSPTGHSRTCARRPWTGFTP